MKRLPDLEARFDALGVEWTLTPDFDTTVIDLDASAAEQYRLQTIDDATVDRYATDMARGDTFPPVIVRQLARRMVIVGGMHRVHAAVRAGRPVDAYVIRCTAARARLLAYEDNRSHGRPLSPAERAELAARMVRLDRVSVATAAASVGAGEPQVRMALDGHKALERADRLAVQNLAGLSYQIRAGLNRIADDVVFADAARTVVACNMGGPSVQRLVSQVKAVDRADALDRLADLRAARQHFGGGRGKARTDRIRLIDCLFDLMDVDPAEVAADLSDDQVAVISDRCLRAARHLMAIDKAIRS